MTMSSSRTSLACTAAGDVDAAERYAHDALEIVPYWHYVRDILLPQILAAKAEAK